ncbi:MAG: dUTP diphosphatase [Eubacteriales bacterium]|nr:dUTP diphosphatase [Eubacteriales bacterium]
MKKAVKIKKLNARATVPTYGSSSAAGADLYACLGSSVLIKPSETAMIPTGLALEIPDGYVGLIYARSGLACREGLAPANKVGVIDSDYRGEIVVALFNHSSEERTVEDGQRVAQLVITPYVTADFILSDKLGNTERGSGGFGSTGKK